MQLSVAAEAPVTQSGHSIGRPAVWHASPEAGHRHVAQITAQDADAKPQHSHAGDAILRILTMLPIPMLPAKLGRQGLTKCPACRGTRIESDVVVSKFTPITWRLRDIWLKRAEM
jgi:hypothetical protein